MGGFARVGLFTTNIIPYSTGFRITMTGNYSFANRSESERAIRLPFPRYSERQSFDMIFIPDGDYMDVYLDSLNNRFASFAKVESAFLEELDRLVRTNTSNLSRITFWPRRADGSMDFLPPDGMFPEIVPVPVAETPAEIHVVASPTEQSAHILPEQEQGSNGNMVLFIILGAVGVLLAIGILVIFLRKRKK